MYSSSKFGLVISFIIFTLGAIGILFIPFLNAFLKLLLIGILFLIIQIAIYVSLKKRFDRYLKLYNDCDFIKLVSKLEKKYNKNTNNRIKPLYESYLFMCYYYLHVFDKLKPLINRIEDEYSKMKNTINKIDYNYYLFDYYIDLNNYDKVLQHRNEMKKLLQTINLDYNKERKKIYLSDYFIMTYRIALIETKTNKKILQEAEEHFLNEFNNEELVRKVSSANQLVTIYERLDNEEKAKEYADFVIKNHKDYYIDPKRIAKYSK